MTSMQALDYFEHVLRHEELKPYTTVKAYRNDAGQFLAYHGAGDEGPIEPLLTREALIDWSRSHAEDRSRRTLLRHRYALRRFFEIVCDAVRCTNPLPLREKIRKEEPEPRPMPPEDWDDFFSAIDRVEGPTCRYTWTATRDRAAFHLMYRAGLRVSEVAGMTAQAIDSAGAHVIGKGAKARTVPLIPRTRDLLEAWQRARPAAECAELFVSSRLTPWGVRDIERRFERICNTAGIDPRTYHPHSLRHSYGTWLYAHGAQITSIKDWMGHEDIATTQGYVKIADPQRRAEFDRIAAATE